MVILLVVFPMTLDLFRLNLLGKYLSFAFVSLGLVMLWGYGGVLSLGQGVFLGLGGYCMAMFLKLEAATAFVEKCNRLPAFRILWTGIRLPNCPSGGCPSNPFH